MAIGDAATAAGIPLIPATADVRQGHNHHNQTRDIIAERTAAVIAVLKGGTGATTAAGARDNLSVPSKAEHDTKLTKTQTEYAADFAHRDTLIGGRVSKGGDTMSGDLRIPGASAATASYTVAYFNGDGRLSKGASSERFKKFIKAVVPAELGDIFPALHRFQMRTGDGTWKYGWIAERLAETDELREFVVFDTEGRPESIDFIALLIAQNSQLHDRVTALEAHLAEN